MQTRNTCTQHPLARLQNLFSVISFKFDSCKIFATNLNAANSLGLDLRKCSKHFTKV